MSAPSRSAVTQPDRVEITGGRVTAAAAEGRGQVDFWLYGIRRFQQRPQPVLA